MSTDATTKWNNLCNAAYKAAVEAYGRRVRNNADWYEAVHNVMEPLTATKRSALIQYRRIQIKKSGLLAEAEKSTAGQAMCK